MPRVDPSRLFNLLMERYDLIIKKTDLKLSALVQKVGEVVFELYPEGAAPQQQVNPMAMLQKMMAASAQVGGGGGGTGSKNPPPPPKMQQADLLRMLGGMGKR